ncbi:sulfatase [Crateriforma conspicua]|uniref:Arylsulfatase n=1 Tax=Crateriforma conspicua TaxID=2527996 RepID=A0A5C6FK92_9PLAN|nr:sulfatase [Crateriforma conspicua]TWU62705.1 Arylsulfatase [Crateriforma conspicua]
MTRNPALSLIGWITCCLIAGPAIADNEATASTQSDPTRPSPTRPNIVWIIPDDMSANFSCYGETAIETPNVDALAAGGVQFNRAFVTAPVCSTCRSAFITGMYQTSIGAHHHRSGRGERKIELPASIQLVPKMFHDAGYYTTISGWPNRGKRLGKTDYNFQWDASVYDGTDWSERKPGQPFFAQIQTKGGKMRGKDASGWSRIHEQAEKTLGSRTSKDVVQLPPYYPQHPDLVTDWAAYLDSVRMTDHMVGEVLQRLEDEGIRENTLVLFMTDHGISHARGKQFLYDEGIHVPLVISGPGLQPGTVRNDVVEHIDIAALSLGAAGIEVPTWMQAQDILADDYQPRDAVFAARDRCDETVDHIRSVRTADFKYIRNFLPQRPHLQPCAYKDAKAILIALRQWHDAGKLDAIQELIFRPTRPAEELYDLAADPYEINNLADVPGYQDKLAEMRSRLDRWMEDTGDQGRQMESAAMYDSDMEEYLRKFRKPDGDKAHMRVIESNIALMKKWAAEGK